LHIINLLYSNNTIIIMQLQHYIIYINSYIYS